MSLLNLQIPVSGQPNSTEDPKIASDLSAIQGVINGGIDASNITAASLVGSLIAASTITPDKLTSGSGSSPFLKLATAADKKIAFGAVTAASFGGANMVSGSFAHGLGSTPTIGIGMASPVASQANGGNPVPVICSFSGYDATNVNYQLRVGDGGNSNFAANIIWLAIA